MEAAVAARVFVLGSGADRIGSGAGAAAAAREARRFFGGTAAAGAAESAAGEIKEQLESGEAATR